MIVCCRIEEGYCGNVAGVSLTKTRMVNGDDELVESGSSERGGVHAGGKRLTLGTSQLPSFL